MPFKVDERVRETSTTQGVGTYTLGGAPTGFQPFSVLGANNYTRYFATDGASWEAGIGRYLAGPDRLERTTILASSNADAAVNWGAGTRTLRCAPLATMDVPRSLSKNVAGGAGTTVLTQDEQRRTFIEFTGALTGARVIEVDATVWPAVYYNNTTGAFSLTVKVAGQAGVVLPQGRRAYLYCDGVDVRPGGPVVADAGLSEFASGTAMLFGQTAAPVGWTKSVTHNDKALRIVSGTVGSGGATAFSSVFGAGKVTGAKTLATAETPAHVHGRGESATQNLIGGASSAFVRLNTAPADNTNSTGGGGSHDHTLSLDLQYVDAIIATKD